MSWQRDFVKWSREAHEAGIKAANETTPRPMVVYDAQLNGTPTPGGNQYVVPEGVCGFAWVAVRPRNTTFARWLKTNGGRSSDYDKAILRWVDGFGQSYERKRAYAGAYAAILRSHGINATAQSRLD